MISMVCGERLEKGLDGVLEVEIRDSQGRRRAGYEKGSEGRSLMGCTMRGDGVGELRN